ncbi:MAG: DUF3291 domain-containing protein [Acidimicrobiia bacterium]
MSSTHHLAQINIGRLRAPSDDPMIAPFMDALDEINALAEASPGFVWRFQTDEGNTTSVRPYDDELILINFSVWESIEALSDYAYRTDHATFLRRRREWFERMTDAYLALWWVPIGHHPTEHEAIARVEHLRAHGPTPHAFTFRDRFPPDAL